MASLRRILVAGIALPAALSCASILGIEQAELKPDTSGGDAGGEPGPSKSLCVQYCAAAMANCTGENRLYPKIEYCLPVCDAMPAGMRGDRSGNTVGCRLLHAQAAGLGETALNCNAAGPGGDGICGENCESWCALDRKLCPDVYATDQDCADACATFPVLGNYNDSIQSGNSFECRLYHVTAVAGLNDPDTHCPHTDITIHKPPCID